MSHHPVSHIVDAITYVNQFRGQTFLIKLGGSILEDSANLEHICDDLKLLIQAGINIVIVHGGSTAINQTLAIHRVESQFVDGLRVTSVEAIKIIEMVLCGHVNKQLVRQLNHIGIQATGLSGSDNTMLKCEPYSSEHGYVGVIKSVNIQPILQLIHEKSTSHSSIPIIAPIGVSSAGEPMNINADHAASQLAIALQVDKLIYLTDQTGIYDKSGCLISQLNMDELCQLIDDQTVQGGMLTKSKAILAALQAHLNHVHILNGNHKHVLIEELFTTRGVGTLCNAEVIS